METNIQGFAVVFAILMGKIDKDNDYMSIVIAIVLVFIGLYWLDDRFIVALCILALSPYYIFRVIWNNAGSSITAKLKKRKGK